MLRASSRLGSLLTVALYRKYRPATFAEVVGQEHVTEPLSTALTAGRINHAYLFSGPRGCGKTSSARILARSLNCEQGPTATPCGVCDSCVGLAPNGPGSIDVVELDAASHGGVDDTRELRDRAFYAPAQSRYRVFIIDEAHMVTTAGFNALLKIVEEPPDHLIFVFATTEPEKVLPTIRSRTHHYPFRLLAPRTMRGAGRADLRPGGRGRRRCGVPAGDPRRRRFAARHVVGARPVVGRRGRQSGQLPAGAGAAGRHRRGADRRGVDALGAGDAAAMFGAVESVIDAGHDPRRFATDLLERFRDLIVLQAVPDAVARGVVDAPEDVLERMRDQAARIGPATLTRYAEVVHAGLGEMRGATAPRLLLEVVCARLLLPSASDTESALLQRVERIETRLDMSIPQGEQPGAPKQFSRKSKCRDRARTSRPRRLPSRRPHRSRSRHPSRRASRGRAEAQCAEPPPEPAPEPQAGRAAPVRQPADPVVAAPPPAAVTGEPNAAAVRSMWTTVRDKVRQRSRTTEVMLAGAIVRAVEGNTLVLSHESAPLAKRLTEQRNADVIAEALKDALGVDWRIRCEAGAGRPASLA